MAIYLINLKFKEEKSVNVKEETTRIIKIATNLIRAKIRVNKYTTANNPTTQEVINDQWIPDNLNLLMKTRIKSELK